MGSIHFLVVPFVHCRLRMTSRHSKASEGRGEGIGEEFVSLHHRGQGLRQTNQRSSLARLRYPRAQALAELHCTGTGPKLGSAGLSWGEQLNRAASLKALGYLGIFWWSSSLGVKQACTSTWLAELVVGHVSLQFHSNLHRCVAFLAAGCCLPPVQILRVPASYFEEKFLGCSRSKVCPDSSGINGRATSEYSRQRFLL